MDKNKFNISLREEEKELTETIKNLNEKLSAIQSVLKVYEKDFLLREQPELFNPQHFTAKGNIETKTKNTSSNKEGLSINKKLLESLELIGSGTANEVADTLRELYPEFTSEKSRNDARMYLSKLKSMGIISGKKMEGKATFIYSFIKQEEVAELQPQ